MTTIAEADGGARSPLSQARAAIATGDLLLAELHIAAALTRTDEERDAFALLAWTRAERGDEAGAVYALQRLALLMPLDVAQLDYVGRHYQRVGRPEAALPLLRSAARAAEPQARAALIETLSGLGHHADALGLALSSLRHERSSDTEWLRAGIIAGDAGRRSLGLRLLRRGVARFPESAALRLGLAQLLLNTDQASAAVALLDPYPADPPPDWFFVHSVALAQIGRFPDATAAIDRAMALRPDERDFARHAATLLAQQGRFPEASAVVDRVLSAALGEADAEWLRTMFTVHVEAGNHAGAVEVGAMLIQRFPDDTTLQGVYQTVIERNLFTRRRVEVQPQAARPVQSRAADAHSLIRPYSAGRSLAALIRREMKTRFGKARLGYLWVIFEPLAHIGIMIFLIGSLNHGGLPPVGTSFAVFYFTGIIPYHIFTHTTSHLIGTVPENKPLLQIPRVKIVDIFLARAVLEGITELVVASIILTAFVIMGLEALPLHPLGVLSGLALLWMAGAGIGMVSAGLASIAPAWERIWGAMASVIYFTSGTFYVPRAMPIWLRDVLVWNPVLQGIELVRLNYFHEPRPEWLNVPYLAGFACVALAAGFLLERMMRSRMLGVE